jgi:hypothetical protein
MANRNYRMTAIQVKVLFPFVIPYVRAFGFFDGDVIDWIYIKEFHVRNKFYPAAPHAAYH